MPTELEQIRQMIREFRDERDWMQFHNPKNLACSISIEAAELLEHFQWKTFEEANALSAEKRKNRPVWDCLCSADSKCRVSFHALASRDRGAIGRRRDSGRAVRRA